MNEKHVPVLFKESLDYLVVNKSGVYFDGTLGFGGHSSGILERINDKGLLIACDVDNDAFTFSKNKFSSDQRVKLYNYNFSQIDFMAKVESVSSFDGIFADLGVSSFQLDNPGSGFTYREDAKLDLRMDKTKAINAADIVNSFSEEELSDIFFKYGEERHSRHIARRIIERRNIRRIETTAALVDAISSSVPFKNRAKSLSRIFQALRIYINDELEVLKSFLNKAVDLLAPGGRIVILSYHSLEDRIVKETFRYETLDCICPKEYPVCQCEKEKRLNILTKKPVTPSEEELNS
jgi:16S rRNA (cytosine1402-N4)-methyltransferase